MSVNKAELEFTLDDVLLVICRYLGRDLPPPKGWRATEIRSEDGLSVYEVQRGGGIDPATVGTWGINAGPPRDKDRFITSGDAIARAETLERLDSESRA